MPNLKYIIGAAPLQNPIAGPLFLTQAWHEWFVDLQRQFLVRWEDLRFPAQGINPPGAAADPGVDTTTGLLVFSPLLDNVIAGVAQMPHGWLPGSAVHPHLHLRFPTSAVGVTTTWRFDYAIANVEENFVAAAGTYASLATITVPNPQDVLKHVVGAFGELSMTGFRESAIIMWRVWRIVGGAGDDPNATHLMEWDLHYQVQKQGTVPEYPT